MWRFLPPAIRAAERDPHIRAVAFRGAGGGAFSAGADVSEFAALRSSADDARAYADAIESAQQAIATSAKPTAAFIRGWCLGGGCEIAVACDVRIAASDARFGIPSARRGIVLSPTSVARLVAEIGPGWTRYLLMTAETVDAETAARIGMVQTVATDDAAEQAWCRVLDRFSSLAPVSLAGAKTLVEAAPGGADAASLAEKVHAASFTSEEYRRSVAAIASGEPAVFDDVPWPS